MTTDKAARIAADAEALYGALSELFGVIYHSDGVVGWPVPGDFTEWDNLEPVSAARAVLRRVENATNTT